MSPKTKLNDLIHIRISPEHLRTIDDAARSSGLSRTAFVRASAITAAKRAIPTATIAEVPSAC